MLLRKHLYILSVILCIFLSCNTPKKVEDKRIYNSLSSISLLNIPADFLPEAGACKTWFPDYSIDKQPFSSSCKSNFMESKISQIIITNEGTEKSPMYSVMEMIKAKEGFSVRTLYFKNI